MIIKIIVIAALVRLLIVSESPILCASIYTVIVFALSLISGAALIPVFVASIITFALVFLYFYLLNRFDTGSAIWWIIAVVGVLLIFL